MEFKVGDIITGLSESNTRYSYTTDDAIMEVIGIGSEDVGEIRVKIIDAKPDARYFDFTKEHIGEDYWVDQKYFKKIKESKQEQEEYDNLLIKKVKYSGRKTIVFWNDGTKTIVTCSEDDIFDPQVGIAMATMKKYLGNNTNMYHEYFDKFIGK